MIELLITLAVLYFGGQWLIIRYIDATEPYWDEKDLVLKRRWRKKENHHD